MHATPVPAETLTPPPLGKTVRRGGGARRDESLMALVFAVTALLLVSIGLAVAVRMAVDAGEAVAAGTAVDVAAGADAGDGMPLPSAGGCERQTFGMTTMLGLAQLDRSEIVSHVMRLLVSHACPVAATMVVVLKAEVAVGAMAAGAAGAVDGGNPVNRTGREEPLLAGRAAGEV